MAKINIELNTDNPNSVLNVYYMLKELVEYLVERGHIDSSDLKQNNEKGK